MEARAHGLICAASAPMFSVAFIVLYFVSVIVCKATQLCVFTLDSNAKFAASVLGEKNISNKDLTTHTTAATISHHLV